MCRRTGTSPPPEKLKRKEKATKIKNLWKTIERKEKQNLMMNMRVTIMWKEKKMKLIAGLFKTKV